MEDQAKLSSEMMFGIKLRPAVARLREDVEQFYGTPLSEERGAPNSGFHSAVGFNNEGRPQITLFDTPSESDIAHELLHLKLHAEGYPMINFCLPSDLQTESMIKYLRMVRVLVFDTLEHKIIYERMRRMGFAPEVEFRDEMEETIRKDTLVSSGDEYAFPRAAMMFFKASIEAQDAAFLQRLKEWYVSKGWESQMVVGLYFVNVVNQGKVDSPTRFVEVLKGIMEIKSPPSVQYEFKGWEVDDYPHFKLKSITFEATRVYKQQPRHP